MKPSAENNAETATLGGLRKLFNLSLIVTPASKHAPTRLRKQHYELDAIQGRVNCS